MSTCSTQTPDDALASQYSSAPALKTLVRHQCRPPSRVQYSRCPRAESVLSGSEMTPACLLQRRRSRRLGPGSPSLHEEPRSNAVRQCLPASSVAHTTDCWSPRLALGVHRHLMWCLSMTTGSAAQPCRCPPACGAHEIEGGSTAGAPAPAEIANAPSAEIAEMCRTSPRRGLHHAASCSAARSSAASSGAGRGHATNVYT